jgi:hypothetical protein
MTLDDNAKIRDADKNILNGTRNCISLTFKDCRFECWRLSKEGIRMLETTEIPFIPEASEYRMADHKHNEHIGEMEITDINTIINKVYKEMGM